jgi:hypothetical protein
MTCRSLDAPLHRADSQEKVKKDMAIWQLPNILWTAVQKCLQFYIDHPLRWVEEDPRNPTPQPVSPVPHGFNQPHNLLKQAYPCTIKHWMGQLYQRKNYETLVELHQPTPTKQEHQPSKGGMDGHTYYSIVGTLAEGVELSQQGIPHRKQRTNSQIQTRSTIESHDHYMGKAPRTPRKTQDISTFRRS